MNNFFQDLILDKTVKFVRHKNAPRNSYIELERDKDGKVINYYQHFQKAVIKQIADSKSTLHSNQSFDFEVLTEDAVKKIRETFVSNVAPVGVKQEVAGLDQKQNPIVQEKSTVTTTPVVQQQQQLQVNTGDNDVIKKLIEIKQDVKFKIHEGKLDKVVVLKKLQDCPNSNVKDTKEVFEAIKNANLECLSVLEELNK